MQGKDTPRRKLDDKCYRVECAECGREFEAARSDASFCSGKCRKQWHMRPAKKLNRIAWLTDLQHQIRSTSYEYSHSRDVFEALLALKNTIDYSLGNFEIPSNTGE